MIKFKQNIKIPDNIRKLNTIKKWRLYLYDSCCNSYNYDTSYYFKKVKYLDNPSQSLIKTSVLHFSDSIHYFENPSIANIKLAIGCGLNKYNIKNLENIYIDLLKDSDVKYQSYFVLYCLTKFKNFKILDSFNTAEIKTLVNDSAYTSKNNLVKLTNYILEKYEKESYPLLKELLYRSDYAVNIIENLSVNNKKILLYSFFKNEDSGYKSTLQNTFEKKLLNILIEIPNTSISNDYVKSLYDITIYREYDENTLLSKYRKFLDKFINFECTKDFIIKKPIFYYKLDYKKTGFFLKKQDVEIYDYNSEKMDFGDIFFINNSLYIYVNYVQRNAYSDNHFIVYSLQRFNFEELRNNAMFFKVNPFINLNKPEIKNALKQIDYLKDQKYL